MAPDPRIRLRAMLANEGASNNFRNKPTQLGLNPSLYSRKPPTPEARALARNLDSLAAFAGIGIKPSVVYHAIGAAIHHPTRTFTKGYAPHTSPTIPTLGGRIEDIAPENLLRVFHGTSKTFDEFRPSGGSQRTFDSGGYNALGKGVYVTDNPALASRYAELRAKPKLNEPPLPDASPQVRMHLIDGSKLFNPFNLEQSRISVGMSKAAFARMRAAMDQTASRDESNRILAQHGFEGQNQQGTILMFDPKDVHPWYANNHLLK